MSYFWHLPLHKLPLKLNVCAKGEKILKDNENIAQKYHLLKSYR